MKKLELCVPCAEALRGDGCTLTKLEGGVDRKIACCHCGRRRFGALYEVRRRPGRPRKEQP